ncbi:MAG: hypothetical protein J1G05_05985 [Clostridiales bacterium]|nr:hypothetical protein [Clostridiales bacterium]
MKSKALLTISLCAAVAVAGSAAYKGAPFASAATLTTDYPDIFIDCVNDNLVGLVDFATDGESFAFADKNGITVVDNGERTLYEISNVNALDCRDGVYYYRRGTTSYSLATSELSDYEFSSEYKFARLSDGSEYKIFDDDGKCSYLAVGERTFVTIENDNLCYAIKVYNDVAYALLESDAPNGYGNTVTVKKLDGKMCADVNPSYIDFKAVEKVALGTIKSSLLEYNLDKPHFAKLGFGSYYTQINIYNLSGDYFDIGENDKNGENGGQSKKEYTFKCGEDGAISSDAVVLVLGESGNAKVFTYNDNCYIALSDDLSDDEQPSLEEADFNAYLNAPDWLYSSPYVCDATKAVELTAGDSVKVTGKVTFKIGGRQFYQVQFYEGDEQVTGYVLENFLNSYSETEHPDDKNFGVIDDPRYSDDDLVKIVVLLLIVIALVLIGLTYITYVLTSKKRKALKQAENQTDEVQKSDGENKKE